MRKHRLVYAGVGVIVILSLILDAGGSVSLFRVPHMTNLIAGQADAFIISVSHPDMSLTRSTVYNDVILK
jgi:hypothetical protein